jgi:glycosyltransferase involved in cell wall biosynthesis
VDITAIVCTHNPHPGRFARTLEGLRRQTLPGAQWECLVVDNASTPAVGPAGLSNLRMVREPKPGLSHARRRGLGEAAGLLCVLVDDDNVLAPDYLEKALCIADAHPRVGAFGGRSLAEFEAAPADWQREFTTLLAVRDLGNEPLIAPAAAAFLKYPPCAPIGAGMVLRREAAQAWLDSPSCSLTDRRGSDLTSGGDNDIVLTLCAAGWDVAYFPELFLTHLIPSSRLAPGYLARLNEGIQRSWVRVLSLHGQRPWTPIAHWTVPIRSARAWIREGAWRGPAQRIRWRGAHGRFLGRADIAQT